MTIGEIVLLCLVLASLILLAVVLLYYRYPSELSNYEPVNEKGKSDLRDRLHDRDLLIETISTDVRSCGILVTDLSQSDTFKFAHKSFFEFLVAQNLIYTRLRLPVSKEIILNHAASNAIERQNAGGLLGTLHFDREMLQFAGEILYANSGCVGKIDADLDRALVNLGLPLRLLKLVARLSRPGAMQAAGVILSVYLQLGLAMARRLPFRMPLILAVCYRSHGHGGDEFLRYEDGLEKARSSMIEGFKIVLLAKK